MKEYKKGELVTLNLDGKNIEAIVVRPSGSGRKVVCKSLNGIELFFIEGKVINKFDSQNITNVILKQCNEIFPFDQYIEAEDLEEIKLRIEELFNEFR